MTKTAASSVCATVGVVLVVLSVFWYSEAALFGGLALLVVSHVLTPCLDRIAVWRNRLLK